MTVKWKRANKTEQQTDGNRAIWLVYRTNTNARGFWLVKPTLGVKKRHPRELSRNQPILRYDVILQDDWPIEQCLRHIRILFGGKTKRPSFDLFAVGHQPAAPIFLSDLRFFVSMVPWFPGSMVRWLNGSMVHSARWPINKCLAAALVFLFRAIHHFVLFSCEFKICAEVVVQRMFAVFLNSLNGKNSSRTILRDIFSFFF